MSLGPITLDRNKRASLQAQLAVALKAGIRDGSLQPGQPLPSTRELASDLAISRNTVVGAFDQLVSEGYLDSRPRSGLYVSESLASVKSPSPRPEIDSAVKPATPRRLPSLSGPRAFRPCQPDVRLFPLTLWNRIRSRALKRHGTSVLSYQSDTPLGWPPLQKAIADYLSESRSVQCNWEQVAITSGSQQALYLLSQLMLRPGNRTVLMEDPGYPGALSAFRSAGAEVRPIKVDAEGMIPPDRIPPGAVVYTTPSRQFPTGAVLTVARRLALLQAAQRAKAIIFEDDYDSEFRYTRAPMPSLHSLDTAGCVIYIGSMSKALLPTLRIGYAVLPRDMVTPFGTLRSIVDDHGPLIDQATLADFISTGGLYSHIRRCRREYRARLDAFLSAVHTLRLPLAFPHTDGGMNLCGAFRNSRHKPDAEISREALSKGVEVTPISSYTLQAEAQGLLFGFTAFDPSATRQALKRLAPLLADKQD